MAICLSTQQVYTATGTQGNSTNVVTLVIVENTSATPESCGMVALSGQEYAAYTGGPFSLTAEQGATVGGAILAVWGAAWVFRSLMRLLSTSPEKDT